MTELFLASTFENVCPFELMKTTLKAEFPSDVLNMSTYFERISLISQANLKLVTNLKDKFTP